MSLGQIDQFVAGRNPVPFATRQRWNQGRGLIRSPREQADPVRVRAAGAVAKIRWRVRPRKLLRFRLGDWLRFGWDLENGIRIRIGFGLCCRHGFPGRSPVR